MQLKLMNQMHSITGYGTGLMLQTYSRNFLLRVLGKSGAVLKPGLSDRENVQAMTLRTHISDPITE